MQLSKAHNYLSFFLAVIYASTLAFILPLDGFKDRLNYLEYADKSIFYLLIYLEKGMLSFLTNEPFFLFFNNILRLFFEAETVLQLFIFIPAFLFLYTVLKVDRKNMIWLIMFLLLPQVLKNHVMQLRQGFAVAVFVYAWFSLNGKTKWLFMLLTPFIHSSMFIIVSLLFFVNTLKFLHFSVGIRNVGVILLSLVAAIGLLHVASSLGARQAARYDDTELQVSGMAFIYWFAVPGFLLFIRDYLKCVRRIV